LKYVYVVNWTFTTYR